MEFYLISILVLLLLAIVYSYVIYEDDKTSSEKFVSLSSPLENVETFMIKDLKTNLWLNISGNGKVRFVPSGFGFNFRVSQDPENFLPLRSANDPNNYIIASSDDDKSGNFRIVTNPSSDLLKIQVMNLGGKGNILGYTNNDNKDVFIHIDQAGYVHTVENVSEASIVNMIFV